VAEMPLTLQEVEALIIVSAGGTLPAEGARLREAMVLMGRGLIFASPGEASRIHYPYDAPPPRNERWQATPRGHALAVALLEKAVG
jgi:hypothetical protein